MNIPENAKNYVNGYDKYVGSVIVYEGYDEEEKDWDGSYYYDENCTIKVGVEDAKEIFNHNNVIINNSDKDGYIYRKATGLVISEEEGGSEAEPKLGFYFECCEPSDEKTSAFVPQPKAEDVGKILVVREKDGEYYPYWMTPANASEG